MRMKEALGIFFSAIVINVPFAPSAHAQAGPPFFTNDPGTPGATNWEINVGWMQTLAHNASSNQIPLLDLNFGVGDRVQLSYEIPYVFETNRGQSTQSGWSNADPGVKWRFLDEGDEGWQASVFPQVETGVSAHAQQLGTGVAGPRYFLPAEFSRNFGTYELNFEAGYYFAGHGPRERTLGLVAGRQVTGQLELDIEIYDDYVHDAGAHTTTLDVGGRYKLARGLIALFMAGRGINSLPSAEPGFVGYVGIQILLGDYGRAFISN
ncbi:MAG TPA: hypothetical protein VF848_05035 [Steroidobacteraceae bacterium]